MKKILLIIFSVSTTKFLDSMTNKELKKSRKFEYHLQQIQEAFKDNRALMTNIIINYEGKKKNLDENMFFQEQLNEEKLLSKIAKIVGPAYPNYASFGKDFETTSMLKQIEEILIEPSNDKEYNVYLITQALNLYLTPLEEVIDFKQPFLSSLCIEDEKFNLKNQLYTMLSRTHKSIPDDSFGLEALKLNSVEDTFNKEKFLIKELIYRYARHIRDHLRRGAERKNQRKLSYEEKCDIVTSYEKLYKNYLELVWQDNFLGFHTLKFPI